jgi:hypothetical protein
MPIGKEGSLMMDLVKKDTALSGLFENLKNIKRKNKFENAESHGFSLRQIENDL